MMIDLEEKQENPCIIVHDKLFSSQDYITRFPAVKKPKSYIFFFSPIECPLLQRRGLVRVTMDRMQHLSVVTLLVLGAWCQASLQGQHGSRRNTRYRELCPTQVRIYKNMDLFVLFIWS